MNEIFYRVLVFFAGLVLGTLFFGGLWLTVKKTITSKIPALLVFGSFICRISITMIGFYFIGAGNWQRLVICASGFLIARFIVINLTKSPDARQTSLTKEAGHETES